MAPFIYPLRIHGTVIIGDHFQPIEIRFRGTSIWVSQKRTGINWILMTLVSPCFTFIQNKTCLQTPETICAFGSLQIPPTFCLEHPPPLPWRCEGDCKLTPSSMDHPHLVMSQSLGTYFTLFCVTFFPFIFGTCNHQKSVTWPATSSEWHAQFPKGIKVIHSISQKKKGWNMAVIVVSVVLLWRIWTGHEIKSLEWIGLTKNWETFFLRCFTVSPVWTDIAENTSVCRREFVKTSFFCLDNKLERTIV